MTAPLRANITGKPHDDTDATGQRFSLSATQVLASMAAAVTAALVGSRLGVAGTVIGAGLASVISVVGGAVIGHSMLLTRNQMKRAVSQVRRGPEGFAETDHTVVIPAVTRLDLERATQGARRGPGHAEPGRPHPTRPSRRVSTGLLLGVAATIAIFVSSLGAVTLFETIKGSPLSGGESGGLSVLGGNGGNPVDAPVTTAIVTETSTVTQTVTAEVTAPVTTAQSSASQSPAAASAANSAAVSSPSVSSQPSSAAPSTPAAAPNSVASAGIASSTAGLR